MLEQLHAAIEKVCPIVGVSSDGQIDFGETATLEQRNAAQAIIASWNPDKPQVVSIDSFKAYLAQIRYEKEIGGIVVGDYPIATNLKEMTILSQFLMDMVFRPGVVEYYEYQLANGTNTRLTPEQAKRIYECSAWYQQACVATERQLSEAIDAGTPLKTVEAMLGSVWPQTQFDWTAPS